MNELSTAIEEHHCEVCVRMRGDVHGWKCRYGEGSWGCFCSPKKLTGEKCKHFIPYQYPNDTHRVE